MGKHTGLCDPEGTRREQCMEVLKSIGGIDDQGKPLLCHKDSDEVKMVWRVLPRILRAAQEELIAMERELLADKALESDNWEYASRSGKLSLAKRHLSNWKQDGEGFLVVDVDTPNAFVHAMVPRLIFVHRGIFRFEQLSPIDPAAPPLLPDTRVALTRSSSPGRFQPAVVLTASDSLGLGCDDMRSHLTSTYEVQLDNGSIVKAAAQDLRRVESRRLVESDEQLAMLLGHELSHVIHGHVEDAALVRGMAAGTNLLIIALLNLRGLVPFCVEAASGALTYSWVLKGKRSHETEADATGLRLVARACYDPRQAVAFLQRALTLDEANSEHRKVKFWSLRQSSWCSDHPSTADRIQRLQSEQADAVQLYEEALAREVAAAAAANAACASHNDRRARGRRPVWFWSGRRVEQAAALH